MKQEGLLISKDTLCARLGVLSTSFEASQLQTSLEAFQYRGPFSGRRTMWWWKAVQTWWSTTFKSNPSVLTLEASQRVQLLHEKALVGEDAEAKRIQDGYSSRFTGVCAVQMKPLDPIDGYLLDDEQARPWLDRQYVSREVAHAPARFGFDMGRLDPRVRSSIRGSK